MKKWLNIKPKVYDFSEDEVDTETESEDDGMCLRRSLANSSMPLLSPKLSISHFCFLEFYPFYNFVPACSLKDERTHNHEDRARRAQRNLSTCSSRISGNSSIAVL